MSGRNLALHKEDCTIPTASCMEIMHIMYDEILDWMLIGWRKEHAIFICAIDKIGRSSNQCQVHCISQHPHMELQARQSTQLFAIPLSSNHALVHEYSPSSLGYLQLHVTSASDCYKPTFSTTVLGPHSPLAHKATTTTIKTKKQQTYAQTSP